MLILIFLYYWNILPYIIWYELSIIIQLLELINHDDLKSGNDKSWNSKTGTQLINDDNPKTENDKSWLPKNGQWKIVSIWKLELINHGNTQTGIDQLYKSINWKW